MVIISATGGSGSSFVADEFRKHFWNVCLRPDGGHQKATHTPAQIFLERTRPFYTPWANDDITQKEMFNQAYQNLKGLGWSNIMLLCMSWGGLGFLNNLEEKPIFLVRDPIFAFNSYSGGGWRKEGGARRIKYVGATGPNDMKWVNLWLNDFAFWINGAKNALNAHKEGTGYIVRYHNFKNDWAKIPNVPPIHENFSSKDNIEKLQGFLTDNTISYIKDQTAEVWNSICEIE
tara:strand:- start:795 stop:1490 length:696 start_codon:yes stop_codon:yes gene_type:complete